MGVNSILFISFVFVSVVLCDKVRYDNFTLYKILPANLRQIKLLQELQSNIRYDFWSDPVPSTELVTVMTSSENRNNLENFLKGNNIKAEITVTNVQEIIDKEKVNKYSKNKIQNFGWDTYHDLQTINAWLDDLISTYPSIVSEVIGGVSYEGRQIKGIKISHGSGRKVIFVEGGIHSREFIAVSTVCYIIKELLTSEDAETKAAAHDFDWYIFPVLNPDGYIYAHEVDRMWRKNRRPIGSNFGVDLNRNWNNNWLLEGSSTNPAHQNYAGPGPFSEPETRSFSTFLRSKGAAIELYLSFHSFGQLLLIPFGNTTQPLTNYHDAMNIGRRAMGALSVEYGTQYTTGNIAEAIYLATGGSIDWVKEHLQVPLVYCYELRDRGTYGFILPVEQILPNNKEAMDSVIDLIYQAKRFGYLNGGRIIHIPFFLIIVGVMVNF